MQKNGLLFIKLLLVVLAFVLMVVSSSLYCRNMLRNHLHSDAINTLTQTKLGIESELLEAQTSLNIVSSTIRRMILQGNSVEMVQEYLSFIGAEIRNKTRRRLSETGTRL